jgi:hypothetical protein
MRKFGFLLFLSNLCFGLSLHAQIVDGSFTHGYTGWTLVGLAQNSIPDSSTPPSDASFDALISSTTSAYEGDPTNGSDSATVSQLNSALGVTLPGSAGSSTVVDGQAIVQSFSLASSGVLTFEFASSSEDYSSYDQVGYVLDNAFHALSKGQSSYTSSGSISLGAGSHTLGFVAYNTGDNFSPTEINVANVEVTELPEPATWLLLACGCGILALAGRRPSTARNLASSRIAWN